MGQKWYVVKTRARREGQVAALLVARDVEAYLPLVTTPRDRRLGPLFPGYLFTRLDVESNDVLYARSAPGVSYILGCDGRPSPVPEDVVQVIRGGVEERGGVLKPGFQPGDRVRILGGPFQGLEAVFDCSLRPTGRSRVLISVLGRLIPLSVGEDLLDRAD